MVFSCLPGGWTRISMPQVRGFLILRTRAPLPPPNISVKVCWKYMSIFGTPSQNGGHFCGNVPNDAFQLPLGREHVVPLSRGGNIAR